MGSIPLALASGSNQITVNGSVILQLAATDTIRVNVIMGRSVERVISMR